MLNVPLDVARKLWHLMQVAQWGTMGYRSPGYAAMFQGRCHEISRGVSILECLGKSLG